MMMSGVFEQEEEVMSERPWKVSFVLVVRARGGMVVARVGGGGGRFGCWWEGRDGSGRCRRSELEFELILLRRARAC